MSRNDAEDFANRLYSRLPADYRARDAERNQPLWALLRVVGEQAANLRQDLDALWDNFFIETCDDWVVPYLGALLGTNLLAHPVGQSNRLDVWNTVVWRRSKGTPRMLGALATAISEWPTDLAEFFQQLGWSQNMNHVRLEAALTPDLHDRYLLSLLGRAADPFAHAADFKPSNSLDQPRVGSNSLGIGRAGGATPGRYQIRNLGFFVRRLQAFPMHGATPAAVAPGTPVPADAFCFTFDPLHRDIPLFVEQSQAPLTRAAFDHAPWETFGKDVAVRQFGVLLADEIQPQPAFSSSHAPFTFGGGDTGLSLRPNDGIRLMQPELFQLGAVHFVITAEWRQDDSTSVDLGKLSTLYDSLGADGAFESGGAATGTGRLVIAVQTGNSALGSWGPPSLPSSPAARFPGATVAIRAARTGPLQMSDGLYIYLPPVFLTPADQISYFVADDGSTYFTADLETTSLARAAEGQVYPPRASTPSPQPALAFTALNRGPGGLGLPDPTRFDGADVFIQAELFTGSFQPLGGIATIDQSASDYPLLNVPDPWPAFTYGPNPDAVTGSEIPGLLTVFIKPLSAGAPFIPPVELIVVNRNGQSLLVYLPEVPSAPAAGARFFVADDGSTYFVPADNAVQQNVLARKSLAGLDLARQAVGQVLSIPGIWPLQQRRPVAINLCRCERNSLLHPGELGIDPELGRFAFANADPAIGQGGLSVDYVESFSDRVGAVNFDRQINPARLATRLVSHSGDAGPSISAVANAPIYSSVSAAIADAQDNDVIEIVDSATYAESATTVLSDVSVLHLTLRAAAQQRPCLTYYSAPDSPAPASLLVASSMAELELNGLLISGGPFVLQSSVQQLLLVACTLDPRTAIFGSLVANAADQSEPSAYLLCRCLTGGLRLGPNVSQLTVADSIVDQQGGFALAAASEVASPPLDVLPEPANVNVQLERVTVFGQISCDVLSASECLFDDIVQVLDQQSGCIRFTRFEVGSVLPRRYRCIPTDEEAAAWPTFDRVMPPLFHSRQFGRPDYAQLGLAGLSLGISKNFVDMTAQEKMRYGQSAILTASEEGAAAYVAAGLRAMSLGDEAIIDVHIFTLAGPTMDARTNSALPFAAIGSSDWPIWPATIRSSIFPTRA